MRPRWEGCFSRGSSDTFSCICRSSSYKHRIKLRVSCNTTVQLLAIGPQRLSSWVATPSKKKKKSALAQNSACQRCPAPLHNCTVVSVHTLYRRSRGTKRQVRQKEHRSHCTEDAWLEYFEARRCYFWKVALTLADILSVALLWAPGAHDCSSQTAKLNCWHVLALNFTHRLHFEVGPA